jgi:hypothetical protein
MNPATELHAVKSLLEEKASGMAGVLERMAALVDRQEAPSEDEVIALANFILGEFGAKNSKEAEVTDKEPQVRSVDPLEQKARALVMDVLAEGSKPPEKPTKEPLVRPDISPEDLKRRSRELMVQLLTN